MLTWSDNFESAWPTMNDEHRQLLVAINATMQTVLSSDASAAGAAMAQLKSTAEEHFAAEEKSMREAGYPTTQKHTKAHRQLLRHLDSIEELLLSHGTQPVDPTLWMFMKRWFSIHLMSDDKPLAEFMVKHEADVLQNKKIRIVERDAGDDPAT